jgi:hypothetical protein
MVLREGRVAVARLDDPVDHPETPPAPVIEGRLVAREETEGDVHRA